MLPEYLRRAERLLSGGVCADGVDYLAAHPKAGVIMRGTGGIVVLSKNGVSIRLTGERWAQIMEERGELISMRQEVLDIVEQPERSLAGNKAKLFRVSQYEETGMTIWDIREYLNLLSTVERSPGRHL